MTKLVLVLLISFICYSESLRILIIFEENLCYGNLFPCILHRNMQIGYEILLETSPVHPYVHIVPQIINSFQVRIPFFPVQNLDAITVQLPTRSLEFMNWRVSLLKTSSILLPEHFYRKRNQYSLKHAIVLEIILSFITEKHLRFFLKRGTHNIREPPLVFSVVNINLSFLKSS